MSLQVNKKIYKESNIDQGNANQELETRGKCDKKKTYLSDCVE